MSELYKTSKIVKTILEQDEKARNSDNYLYFRVLDVLGKKNGIDINNVPITLFLLNMSAWGFPPFESVRRTRQQAQHDRPELRGNKEVTEFRAEKEVEYRAFARGGA